MSVEPLVVRYLARNPPLNQGNASARGIGLVALVSVGGAMFETKAALHTLVGELEQLELPKVRRFGDC